MVIVIDDTDRMGKDELVELMRLIRLTANFRNLVFIVTCDKQYVVEKLERAGISRSEEYLRKIFQVELQLPSHRHDFVAQLLKEEIKRCPALRQKGSLVKEVEYMERNFNNAELWKLLSSFRDVKLLVNHLLISVDLIKSADLEEELSYADLLWLEMLKVFCNDIYVTLRECSGCLLENLWNATHNGSLYTFLVDLKPDKNDTTERKTRIERVNSLNHCQKFILKRLFADHSGPTSIRRENNYSKYFNFDMPTDILPNQEFKRIMVCPDVEEAKKLAREAVKKGQGTSLYRHLSHFNVAMTNLEFVQPIKNFLAVLFNNIQGYNIGNPVNILRNSLSKKALTLPVNEFIIDEMTAELNLPTADLVLWCKLISSLHSCIRWRDDECTFSNQSVLSDDQIGSLAKMCAERFLARDTLPPVQDITDTNSMLHKLVNNACVTYMIEIDPRGEEPIRKNIILDTLIDTYSKVKDINDLTLFNRPYNESYEQAYDEEFRSKYIAKLFGTVDDYNRFVDACFVRPQNIRYEVETVEELEK